MATALRRLRGKFIDGRLDDSRRFEPQANDGLKPVDGFGAEKLLAGLAAHAGRDVLHDDEAPVQFLGVSHQGFLKRLVPGVRFHFDFLRFNVASHSAGSGS